MKQFILLLTLSLLTFTTQAQTYTEVADHDTTGTLLVLDGHGNPFSGYNLKWERYNNFPNSVPRTRCFQCDKDTMPVRQIVVLEEKWENAPQDILEGGGGHKIVAVSPREYNILKEQNAIWGDAFQRINYMGECDTLYPLVEMIVAPLWAPNVTDEIHSCLEIMSFNDTIGGVKQSFMTTAKNLRKWTPDYTPAATGGKYDHRFICIGGEEERRWIEKSLEGATFK